MRASTSISRTPRFLPWLSPLTIQVSFCRDGEEVISSWCPLMIRSIPSILSARISHKRDVSSLAASWHIAMMYCAPAACSAFTEALADSRGSCTEMPSPERRSDMTPKMPTCTGPHSNNKDGRKMSVPSRETLSSTAYGFSTGAFHMETRLSWS